MKPVVAILLLGSAAGLTGAPSECAGCHAEVVRKQAASRHAKTLTRYPGSEAARLLAASRAERDGFGYAYGPANVTVRRKSEVAAASLEWVFGGGRHGITAVGRYEGLYFEHRLSYYPEAHRTELTPGHRSDPPRTAADALGVLKLPQDIYQCFNCHSTGLRVDLDSGPDLTTMTPGVLCERCHGPGEQHMEAARGGRPQREIAAAIRDPGRAPAKEIVVFCGGCHRLPDASHVSLTPEKDNPVSVRFQPYGLMASRCFRESGILSCVTCHDPHQDLAREPAFYTEKCLACHRETKTRVVSCRRGTGQNCLPCHMQVSTPLPYLHFTDHRIRVY
jgi:hypothetical protein